MSEVREGSIMESTACVLMEDDANAWSIGITRETYERMLKIDAKDRGPAILVWQFYAYTARWQHTNQARATVGFVAKGLGMTEAKVRRARTVLLDLELIEDVQQREGQRIKGWYVKVRHLAKASTLSVLYPVEKPTPRESGDKCFNDSQGKCLNDLEGNAGQESLFPEVRKEDIGYLKKTIPLYDSFTLKTSDLLKQEGFTDAWKLFVGERAARGKKLTKRAAAVIINRCAERPAQAAQALTTAVNREWLTFEWSWLDPKKPNGTIINKYSEPPKPVHKIRDMVAIQNARHAKAEPKLL